MLENKKIKENCLAKKYPVIASQWHPIKNENLTPIDVTAGSNKKVWWYLPYDDPETGKHFDFEWQATINNRIKQNQGCPYLLGGAVWKGYNDLATTHPELVKEWHPSKNGSSTPESVTAGSTQKVWWYLPYDDPKTGKHFNFEWKAIICNRTKQNRGCPYLSGGAVWKGYNDLETLKPELAKEWHLEKNGKLKPSDVTINSGKKVWWRLSYDDPETRKHFDFEWQATVANRTNGKKKCPYLIGQAVWRGYNDLETLKPELAKEWHSTKNGKLKPSDVTVGSAKRVWWHLSYDDSKTGQHFDFEWRAKIWTRTKDNTGCPYLSGQAVWRGYNDLKTLKPEIVKEWHPTKNGKLKPSDVTVGSAKRVWWYLPYDDPETGKHFNFEWQATVIDRVTRERNCPYLSGRAVWKGYNDLETLKPELAKEWHPEKNGKLKPSDVTVGSNKKVWWYLPYDDPETGKHFNFEWQEAINNRTSQDLKCPYLTGQAVWRGYNDLETLKPELAKEWHPTKNKKLKPSDVTVGSAKKVWWYLPYDDPETGKHFNFEWQAIIKNRIKQNQGCPYISGRAVWKGYNDLETLRPEIIEEWCYTKNRNLKPSDVTMGSNKKVWWICINGHEWRSQVNNRVNKASGCPKCNRL